MAQASEMGVENTSPVTEQQKIGLYREAMTALEEKFMALYSDDKNLADSALDSLKRAVSALIEEACAANPENGIQECQSFFQELASLFAKYNNEALEKMPTKGKDELLSRLLHMINLRVTPLLINKMEKLGDKTKSKWYKDDFASTKKMFMKDGFGQWPTIGEKDVPPWFQTVTNQERFEKLQRDSISDPKAAQILKDIRTKVRRDLKGE